MSTFETSQPHINLNTAMQDALDQGRELVLTVGTNNFAKLSIEAAEEKESADAR